MSDFPQRFGKFDLLDLLAKGGMAEVYLARTVAEDPSKRRPLAIKKVLPFLSSDKEFIRMFEREIGITFHLNHPNVIKVFESGFIENSYYIAMEHMLGRTLAGVVNDPELMKSLSETPFAPYVVKEICKALEYAHNFRDPVSKQSCTITHRDISPQNILISYAGSVKLFDFGIARCLIKEGSTAVGVIKGKPAYVSPEQVLGKTVDTRTDIFSLGVVLWEMLAGQRLFVNEQPLITLRNVVEQKILPPSHFNPAVSAELDAVTMKALERDPNLRQQSAGEMGSELENAIRVKFQEFGPDHFSWMMRYFFEQELKAAEEDLSYKLRLKAMPKVPEQITKTLPTNVAPARERSRPALPAPAKQPKKIVQPDLMALLNSDIGSLAKRDARLAYHPFHGVAAALLLAIGALGYHVAHGFFLPEREPASCASAPTQPK